jgi:aspartate aminotransferase-like enzyme
VRHITTPFDAVVRPRDVSAALAEQPVDVVSIVHAESVTGGVNPLEQVASLVSVTGALLVIDAVASVGSHPVTPDASNADLVVVGPQKALA